MPLRSSAPPPGRSHHWSPSPHWQCSSWSRRWSPPQRRLHPRSHPSRGRQSHRRSHSPRPQPHRPRPSCSHAVVTTCWRKFHSPCLSIGGRWLSLWSPDPRGSTKPQSRLSGRSQVLGLGLVASAPSSNQLSSGVPSQRHCPAAWCRVSQPRSRPPGERPHSSGASGRPSSKSRRRNVQRLEASQPDHHTWRSCRAPSRWPQILGHLRQLGPPCARSASMLFLSGSSSGWCRPLCSSSVCPASSCIGLFESSIHGSLQGGSRRSGCTCPWPGQWWHSSSRMSRS